jgi:hypothetical protein
MKKDENPKDLFEKLTAVQFKYQWNAQANITDDDLVAQAVQAIPAIYNSTVAGLYKTEQQLGQAVTINALKHTVGNHYLIVMKGKQGTKTKDIEGGFAAMEDQVEGQDKDNLKKMIKDTINTTIQEFQVKDNAVPGNQGKQDVQGFQQMNKVANKGTQTWAMLILDGH